MYCQTQHPTGLAQRAEMLIETLVYDYRHMTKIGTSMKNLKLFTASAAAVLALSIAGSAHADTYTLFTGNCIENSNVEGTHSTGVNKVYFVKDKTEIPSLTGTSTYYIRLVDHIFQVTNFMKNIIYLEGNATILQNSYTYAGTNGPLFNYSGTVDYTGGLWLDPLRHYISGSAHGQHLTGTWEFSGTAAKPKGVDYLNITVSGPSAVPEPGEWAAMGMLASGLGGLVVRARRRKLA